MVLLVRKFKVVTAIVIIALIVQLTAVIAFAARGSSESSASDVPFIPTYTEGSYGEFLQINARESIPDVKVELDIHNLLSSDNISYGTVDGRSNVLITNEEGYIELQADVPSTGMYSIGVSYYPMAGKSAAIERSIYINGELQFTEAISTILDRIYADDLGKDITGLSDEELRDVYFTHDAYGNETRRVQVESPRWIEESAFKDSSAAYEGYLKFYLKKGLNTIRIESVREPCAFSSIWVYGQQDPVAYGEFQLEKAFYCDGGAEMLVKQQAEFATIKNDPTLFASYDRASAVTEPASVDTIKLNTMGGNASGDPRWRVSGQWLEYEVEVPKAGMYKIVLRARQDTLNGSFVSRKIVVNNQVQFEEAQRIKFTYSEDWKMITPTDDYGEPLLFFFNAGKNTIRFEAVYGEMGDIINAVEAVITKLNKDYRKVIMITGTKPDAYRDYEFESLIPEVISDLKAQADILKNVFDEMSNILGQAGQYTAVIQNTYNQLYTFYEQYEKLASELSTFQTCVTNLGSWLLDIRAQPLEIDYFIVAEENYEVPNGNANFFTSAWFQIRMFFSSFFTDFNNISSASGESYDQHCTVWTSSARDQAQVIRQIIDRSFIPNNKIDVDFELVPGGALLPSILAGKGPDAVLGLSTETIVNYATRNALEPLNSYPGFDKIISERFIENSTEGMSVEFNAENGGYVKYTFGLPEAMSFSMLFYRTDIMNEIGKPIPSTWDDVYELIPVLQKRYMQYAPPDFNSLLYQAGGQLYKWRGQASDLDSVLSIETFIKTTDFYTSYGLPISYDFNNRFRTGEMPIGNSDLYTFYNKMSVFAPEIKGLWTFTVIPGTVKDDGSIDRSSLATFTATVMLRNAKEKENAWKFMDWWTSDEIQTDFGREIESVLGAAGRYNSANKTAIVNMNWTANEIRSIEKQLSFLKPYPQVIAGYYTNRYYGFAFNNVVVQYDDPRETLLDNIKYINDEIINKRTELNLPLDMVEQAESK